MTRKLFVLNGSNLDMLGLREPELYGTTSLDDVRAECERVAASWDSSSSSRSPMPSTSSWNGCTTPSASRRSS